MFILRCNIQCTILEEYFCKTWACCAGLTGMLKRAHITLNNDCFNLILNQQFIMHVVNLMHTE